FGVLRVEDVAVEVAADGHLVGAHLAEAHERVRRQLGLAQRVVLELQLRSELHQLGPVRAGPRAHARGIGSAAPSSSIDQRPLSRTAPDWSPAGNTKKLAASSRVWSRRPPSAS